MKKILAFIFVLFVSYYLSAIKAYAQYGQYGVPAPSYALLLDKMVAWPNISKGGQIICDERLNYADNYSPSDPRFKPNDYLCFRLKVKNTSNTTLTGVTIKDFVPFYIEPINGPGAYDTTSRTITYSAGDFAVDEEKKYYILMRVNSQNQLPADKGLFCIINKAQASNDKTSDDDNSQICIEKQVQGVTKVPQAGPEMGAVLLAGQILALTAGLVIKKKLS